METLDIFHTLFIIYVSVTKTMITFLNTFNFCFTERNGTVLFSPTLPYIYIYTVYCMYAKYINEQNHLKMFAFGVKAVFSASLLQSSVSHDLQKS